MGSVVGTAANGVGTFLGNALAAPFKTLFGVSCEGVCSGTWDLVCFLEHLCVASLGRLFMVLLLSYITLFVVYLLCKIGIFKCVAKSACKVSAAACSGCCRGVGAACCCLWRKVRDTKRVRRGRHRDDVEAGQEGSFASDSDDGDSSGDEHRLRRRRHGRRSGAGEATSVRERRKDRVRQSLRLRRLGSKKGHSMATRSRDGSSGGRRRHLRAGLGSTVEVPSLSRRVHGSARRR